MLRIGVHFEGLSPEAGHRIDRFLARRTHATIRGRATLRDLLFGDRDTERRRSGRVAVIDDNDLSVRMESSGASAKDTLPLAVQASLVALDGAPQSRALRICSISPSGCAYLEEEALAPSPGSELELDLSGAELSLRVKGRVVYALKTTVTQQE